MDPVMWRGKVLAAVRDLADAKYKERVWVRGEGPEVESPTEALCRLLDDYDFRGFLDRAAREGWLAERQLAALGALAAALEDDGRRAPDRSGHDLSSPYWQRVRTLASKTLDAFCQSNTAGVA
jgi:hypothetical protein